MSDDKAPQITVVQHMSHDGERKLGQSLRIDGEVSVKDVNPVTKQPVYDDSWGVRTVGKRTSELEVKIPIVEYRVEYRRAPLTEPTEFGSKVKITRSDGTSFRAVRVDDDSLPWRTEHSDWEDWESLGDLGKVEIVKPGPVPNPRFR